MDFLPPLLAHRIDFVLSIVNAVDRLSHSRYLPVCPWFLDWREHDEIRLA